MSVEKSSNSENTLIFNILAAKTMGIIYQAYGWLLAKPAEVLSYAEVLGLDMEKVKQLNPTELLSYAVNQLDDPNKSSAVLAIFFGFRAYSGLVRYTCTRIVGDHYHVDTKRARVLSLIPYGEYSAIIAQVAGSINNRGKKA